MTKLLASLFLGAVLVIGPAAPRALAQSEAVATERVFEMRTYTTHEGRLDALQRRFRDHTLRVFEKHGMTNVGYWIPQDTARSHNTLVYVLAHPSREAARQNWRAFATDPEWQRIQAESEADGAIVLRIESVFLDPTDFSPLK